MAIQTNGFGNSSFDDVSWAQVSAVTMGPFRVADTAAWRPVIVPGLDRTVSIAPGLGVACGVRAFNTARVNVAFVANSGASVRRDALVARFDWNAETVTFVAIQGSAVPPTVEPGSTPNPARINRIPGVMYDALIAMVNIAPGTGALGADSVSDLRPYGGFGGPLLIDGGEYTDMMDVPVGARVQSTASGRTDVKTAQGFGWAREPRGLLALGQYVETNSTPPRPGRTPLSSTPAGLPAFNVSVPNLPAGRRLRVSFTGMASADSPTTYGFVLVFAGVEHRGSVQMMQGFSVQTHFNISYIMETNNPLSLATGGINAGAILAGNGPVFLHSSGFDGPTQFAVEDLGAR